MNTQRRQAMKAASAWTLVTLVAAAGWLKPGDAAAEDWNKGAFDTHSMDEPLKALGGPFPTMRFCPTGGVDLQKAPDYLKLPNVPCVGGSWMLQKAALAAGDYLAVEALARDAAELRRAA